MRVAHANARLMIAPTLQRTPIDFRHYPKSDRPDLERILVCRGLQPAHRVIEQLTFLMFIERLDDLHTVVERKSEDLGTPTSRSIFPAGTDDKGEPFDNLRWSRFKHFEAREMMRIVDEHESTLTGVV